MNQMASNNIQPLSEKLCIFCNAVINRAEQICPACGTPQKKPIDKAVLLIITFFLGGIGGHKFFTERYIQGTFYLLFCWTFIPGIIALVEFIIYAATDTQTLDTKFPETNGVAIVIPFVASFVMIAVVGILAAIAIPQFVKYRERAFDASMKVQLEQVVTAEKSYNMEHGQYTGDLDQLGLESTNPQIEIEVEPVGNGDCFLARARHIKSGKVLAIDCFGNYH